MAWPNSVEIGAGGHDHDVAFVVDAEAADQLFEIGLGRQHAGHAVDLGAPAGRVVVGVDGTRNVRPLEQIRRLALAGAAHVEHDDAGLAEIGLEPVDGDERLVGLGGGAEDGRDQQGGRGKQGTHEVPHRLFTKKLRK